MSEILTAASEVSVEGSSGHRYINRGWPSGAGGGKGSEHSRVLIVMYSRLRWIPRGWVKTSIHVGPLRPSATGHSLCGAMQNETGLHSLGELIVWFGSGREVKGRDKKHSKFRPRPLLFKDNSHGQCTLSRFTC